MKSSDARDKAIMAVRRWLLALDAQRAAELEAMAFIAAIPGKSVVVDGKRFVAVTSRKHVEIRNR
jgi:hypothetical protein